MEKIKAFIHQHPAQAALMGGVAVLAVLYFFGRSGGSNQGQGAQEAALQNAYFQAEAIQAQAGSNIQVANIQANRDTTLAQIGSNAKVQDDTLWANNSLAITQSNNQTTIASLPYATESELISSLAGVASQTQTTTTQKSSGGFFGIGAGSSASTVTKPTDSAIHAGNYLSELANNLFPGH